MKRLILITSVISFVIVSCSRYQINTLSSTNTLKNQQTGDFEFENDSVKISYSFYGVNAPVHIQVYNKLNKPLYIDWKRSALIVDDKAVSYAGNEVPISGSTIADTYNWNRNASTTYGSVNAVATLPKDVAFIPPHTQINNDLLTVSKGSINIPDSLMHNKGLLFVDKSNGRDSAKVKAATFSKETSPLKFKSYLTLYTSDNNNMTAVAYQHDFYVSGLVSTIINPKELETFQSKRGDFFINSKKTTYGKVMTGVAVAGAVGAAGAATALADKNQQQ